MMMKLNEKANELRVKLFNLMSEFKGLERMLFASSGPVEARGEASSQLNSIGCQLAEIYAQTRTDLDLFIDASRDTQDQVYTFEV